MDNKATVPAKSSIGSSCTTGIIFATRDIPIAATFPPVFFPLNGLIPLNSHKYPPTTNQ